VFFNRFFRQIQDLIDDDSKKSDQETSGDRQFRVVRRYASPNGDTESAGTDERGDSPKGDRHDDHGAEPGHDYRERERQFDAQKQLSFRASHAGRRFDDERIDFLNADIGVAYEWKGSVNGKRDDRAGVADSALANFLL
jgi:hypothetical protein